jgi:aminoglycoside phosphotransferase family enzyme
MFDFLNSQKQTQTERVLELLIKHGKVTSLQLSQMHPVILNFHQQIYALRPFHNIETISQLVNGKKHTTYIYHGRKMTPERREIVKHYTKEDIIKAFNA